MVTDPPYGVEDHPRSRGVYNVVWYGSDEACGSSPLARGLLDRNFNYLRVSRDHPRSRGVYSFIFTAQISQPGSSPLARGLPQMETDLTNDYRIIPARAGFTPAGSVRFRGQPDHPRSRGVYATWRIW